MPLREAVLRQPFFMLFASPGAASARGATRVRKSNPIRSHATPEHYVMPLLFRLRVNRYRWRAIPYATMPRAMFCQRCRASLLLFERAPYCSERAILH